MSIRWAEIRQLRVLHCASLFGVAALSLLSVGFNLLLPWPIKLIVDSVLGGKLLPYYAFPAFLQTQDKFHQLVFLACASAGLVLSARVTEMGRIYIAAKIGRQMQYELGDTLFLHLQRLSPVFHARSQTGDLVRRVVMDSKCAEEFFIGIIIPAATSILMLIAMFTILVNMSLPIALLALLMATPIAILVHNLIPTITEQSLAQQNIEAQIMALAETNLSALPIVHAFDRTELEGKRFRNLTGQSVEALARATASEQLFGVLAGGTIALGTAIVLGVGGFETLNGTLQVGSLLVILTYLALLYAPVDALARLSSAFAHSAAKSHRALAILRERNFVADASQRITFPSVPNRAAGSLHFENVSFAYEAGGSGLHGVNMTISPGETIAIVGPTGAGKSTLASLALRLFDPDTGRITLDGIDLREWPLQALRRQFGLVLQDPFILSLSAADNIALGKPDADLKQIVSAAEAAMADGFIRRFPEGYATRLAEGGIALSGGERQRIANARALLRDAPVLILDEPTAALDIETERSLLAALHCDARNRTTIIIAHRLSTVRGADRILVLDRGQIVESGTHTELLARRGRYSKLHLQSLSGEL